MKLPIFRPRTTITAATTIKTITTRTTITINTTTTANTTNTSTKITTNSCPTAPTIYYYCHYYFICEWEQNAISGNLFSCYQSFEKYEIRPEIWSFGFYFQTRNKNPDPAPTLDASSAHVTSPNARDKEAVQNKLNRELPREAVTQRFQTALMNRFTHSIRFTETQKRKTNTTMYLKKYHKS